MNNAHTTIKRIVWESIYQVRFTNSKEKSLRSIQDEALATIKQLVLDEVIGRDAPGDTNIMIAAEHVRQRQALEKVMGGK